MRASHIWAIECFFRDESRCGLLNKEIPYHILSSVVRNAFVHEVSTDREVISIRNSSDRCHIIVSVSEHQFSSFFVCFSKILRVQTKCAFKLRDFDYRGFQPLRQRRELGAVEGAYRKKLSPSFLANSMKASAMPSCVKPS